MQSQHLGRKKKPYLERQKEEQIQNVHSEEGNLYLNSVTALNFRFSYKVFWSLSSLPLVTPCANHVIIQKEPNKKMTEVAEPQIRAAQHVERTGDCCPSRDRLLAFRIAVITILTLSPTPLHRCCLCHLPYAYFLSFILICSGWDNTFSVSRGKFDPNGYVIWSSFSKWEQRLCYEHPTKLRKGYGRERPARVFPISQVAQTSVWESRT